MKNQICPGCGITLQSQDSQAPGYVPKDKTGTAVVCQRCYQIKHYKKITGERVAEESNHQAIRAATGKADLTLLVADFFDPEGSFAPDWAELIKTGGGQPIKLLVNKSDLLPPKTNREEIEEYLADLWQRRFPGTNLAGVKAVSAKEQTGLTAMLKELSGLRIAIVGAANVGKSSLLVRIIAENGKRYSQKSPTISSFPGTTQGITRWPLSKFEIELFDTPGLIPGSRIGDLLCPECSGCLLPERRLQAKIWELPEDNAVLFGDLAGVWNTSAATAKAVFFSAESLTLHRTNSKKAEKLLKESSQWLRAVCARDRSALQYTEKRLTVKPGEDLYISGLGWLAVKNEPARFRVEVPSGVETGVRPSLIGKRQR